MRFPKAVTCVLAVLLFSAAVMAEEGKKAGLTRRTKEFLEHLNAGRYEKGSALFDATMRRVLPADKLEGMWKSLTGRCGAFQAEKGISHNRVDPYDVVLVTCQFQLMRLIVRLVFNSKKEITGIRFMPAPKVYPYKTAPYTDPAAFTAKEVFVGEGKWRLPGTLTLPAGEGPHPGLVLVHGSGPNDRDGTLGPNKPLRDIAEGLASRGVAVLRYDKRTKVHADKMADLLTTLTVKEEVTDDVASAVAFLKSFKGVDAGRIYVAGHSLGGMLIPRLGTQIEGLAGLIVLAGPARPLEDAVLRQYKYIFGLDGKLSEAEKGKIRELEQQVARVKDPALKPDHPAQDLVLGLPAPYWLDLREYRPADVAKTLAVRLFILQGERDYQVTMDDFALWKSALSTREDVAFKSYPALNHCFMAGSGKCKPVEYLVEGHVFKSVILDLAAWIKKQ